MDKKVDLIVDLQFGSTGKGALCGFLVNERRYDTVVSCNMPNAGHTYMPNPDKKLVFKALPVGACGRLVENVMIGPGSVFSIDQLTKELAMMRNGAMLWIHENAVILNPDHAKVEKGTLGHIASTMQGSAAAIIEKMWRGSYPIIARDVLKGTMFESCLVDTRRWITILQRSKMILAEGSQGYSLGINTSFYPHTTSRDCTPAAFLSGMCIPLPMLRHVYGCARTYPIRVGNIPGGHSGPPYPDQLELQWSDIGVQPETTTVTGRERRVFTFSYNQIWESIAMCGPDAVFLNFCNYLKSQEDFSDILTAIATAGSSVWWTGWGATHSDIKSFPKYDFNDYVRDCGLGGLTDTGQDTA